jgi:hypothetical protein
MLTPKDSFGRISSPALESPECWCLIMDLSLLVGRSENSVSNTVSGIISLLQPTPRRTDKRSPPTRRCWTESKNAWKRPKGGGLKNCQTSCGLTGQLPGVQQEKPLFSLTYGVEAVIPLEIGLPTIRTEYYDPVTNETSLATDLDLAEERRDSALIHLAAYQNGLRRIYEKRINPRELAVGDLVLRKVMGAKQDPTHGKLGPNWEGPYKIASVAGTGAFMLIGPNDTPVKRPWNICNLKKYYQ